MIVHTTRFGPIVVSREDVVTFPEGLVGLADCREWVFVADPENESVAWMQSVDREEIALAVVSPRRFLPDFQMRVARPELEPLALEDVRKAQVLAIVGRSEGSMTLNLKAPVVVNLDRRLGRQVITNGDLPVAHKLSSEPSALRRSA